MARAVALILAIGVLALSVVRSAEDVFWFKDSGESTWEQPPAENGWVSHHDLKYSRTYWVKDGDDSGDSATWEQPAGTMWKTSTGKQKKVYWYKETTKETQWEEPAASKSGWKVYYDFEHGRSYYVKDGQVSSTTWDKPAEVEWTATEHHDDL